MSSHGHHDSASNIKIAFLLNFAFAIFEIIGSFFTGSLAVLSTGLHDLGDTLSLGIALYLDKLSKRERNEKFSYGYRRFSLLGAVTSSLILIIGSFLIISEGINRIAHPEHSNAQGMVLFAIAGIIVNAIAVMRLRKGQKLNEKVIIWHLLDDVFAWAAVLVVALIMMVRDMHVLDPILSLMITLYVLWNVLKNFRKALTIFLQGVPESINAPALEQKIMAIKGVKNIHDTHIWSLDGQYNVLTTHVLLKENASAEEIFSAKCEVKKIVEKNDIQHTTVEVERLGENCKIKE